MINKKMIKIIHNGPIYEKGGVCGPILSPYMEDIRTIWSMIVSGKKVIEVNKGVEIVLTTSNFDKDNTPPKVEKAETVINKPQQPQQQNQNKNNDYNKNKPNRHNSPQQPQAVVKEQEKNNGPVSDVDDLV